MKYEEECETSDAKTVPDVQSNVQSLGSPKGSCKDELITFRDQDYEISHEMEKHTT